MNRFKRSMLLAIGLSVMAVAMNASAQDFLVQGMSNVIIQGQNIDTAPMDKVAVRGISTPQPYYGIGGLFEGGYIGVQAAASGSGRGGRFGGQFWASGGESNYGVYAVAWGGGTYSYAGHFSGNVYISGLLYFPSDFRLKKDVADLSGALSQVLSLRPRTYQYRLSDYPSLNLAQGKQMGLLAQEVATVLPEIVHEVALPTEKGKTPEKILSVDYMKLVPVLIKAIQEQQMQIEALKAEIKQMKKH
jgi:hypothetical protein